MEKHSAEVRNLRLKLLSEISQIDFEKLSMVDHIYLYCLTIFSEMHLRETATGGSEYGEE